MTSSSEVVRRKDVNWRRDPIIQARLPEVERMHLAGRSNQRIADHFGLAEKTIRRDLERIRGLWLERTSGEIVNLKAAAIAQLDYIRRRALEFAEFDRQAERDIIYGDGPDAHMVVRGTGGRVEFRGNKAGALSVARAATMDIARIAGLLVDRTEHSGQVLIRQYVDVDLSQLWAVNTMDDYINGYGRSSIEVSHAKLHGRTSRGEHGAMRRSTDSQTPEAVDPAHQRSMDAAAQIFNTHPSTAHERSAAAASYLTNTKD